MPPAVAPVLAGEEGLARAAELLRAGELVAIPTETVYGLAANGLDGDALARIFAAKGRPRFDPLILHVSGRAEAEALSSSWPPAARRLAEAFWPGPLTLVLPAALRVPAIATAGLPTVALRAPAHPLLRRLLAQLDIPLAAPSANPFGFISPTTAEHVQAQLGDKLSLILDGGPCEHGLESSIVGFPGGRPTLLRHGALPAEELRAVAGELAEATETTAAAQAPGQLASHYAPGTPLRLLPEAVELSTAALGAEPEQIGLLRFRRFHPAFPEANQRILSSRGDLPEAARWLFGTLRELDAAGYALLLAEAVPEEDLGRAINDRLRRAAARRS